MANRYNIMKNCSAFYRLSQIYFSQCFEHCGLGAGQHYFLGEIELHPGIIMAEMAENGAYDNGTVTRAVRRLVSEGYVRMEQDSRDRRVKRLYLTEKGQALAKEVVDVRGEWLNQVTAGFTDEERTTLSGLLGRLAGNAHAALLEGVGISR